MARKTSCAHGEVEWLAQQRDQRLETEKENLRKVSKRIFSGENGVAGDFFGSTNTQFDEWLEGNDRE